MSRLNIAAPAEAEFLDAVAWYRQRDPRVAERFITETRNALHLIETFPQIGGRVPEMDDPDVRRMPIHTFPYSTSEIASRSWPSLTIAATRDTS